MILFDQIIAAGNYTIPIDGKNALVVFNFVNDSPYKCAVNFGLDVGYDNAAYYIPPHGIIQGVPAPVSTRTIGGAWFSGQIYLYVQAPAGGSTDLSNAPASEFQAVGYPAGAAPAATVTMSRMQNIGNSTPLSTTATSISNTGNGPGTSIITAQPSDALSATWSADTSGNLHIRSDNAGTLTDLLHLVAGASPEILIGAANILTQILGTLQVVGASSLDNGQISSDGAGTWTVNALSGPAAAALNIDVAASQSLVVNIGGVATLTLTGGNLHVDNIGVVANNIQFPIGGFSAVHSGNFSASGTVNHNLGGKPTNVLLCPSSGSSTWTFGATNFTTTQFTATIASPLNTDFFCYR